MPDLEILNGFTNIAHVAAHFCPFENTGRIGAGANGARRSVEHGTVCRPTATKTVSFHNSLKSFAFRRSDHIDIIARLKDIRCDFLSGFIFSCFRGKFFQNAKKNLCLLY